MSLKQQNTGVLGAVLIDLKRLHASWMGLVFPRQRTAHSVLGRWTPDSVPMKVAYRLWGLLGAVAIAVLYPFVVLGFATRFYTKRISNAATALGLLGSTLAAAVVWGGLTVAARVQFDGTGFLAVGAAAVVATLSTSLSILSARIGGRGTTVALAYPFAMTAIFLPPVVASFFYQPIFAIIEPFSNEFAIIILDTLPATIEATLRQFTLRTPRGLLGMWAGLSVPLGWVLGIVVTLAELVRPSREGDEEAAATG